LGSRWADAVPILQLLCVGGIFWGLDSSNNDLLKIKNKSRWIMVSMMIHLAAVIAAIWIVLHFKLPYLWLVFALSAIYGIRYFVTSIIANRLIRYRFWEACNDLLPYFLIAMVTTGCGYLFRSFISNKLILMVCQIPVVSILYIGIAYTAGSKIVKEAIGQLYPTDKK
jgi:O-antigen/teichoic acid export membrane protein